MRAAVGQEAATGERTAAPASRMRRELLSPDRMAAPSDVRILLGIPRGRPATGVLAHRPQHPFVGSLADPSRAPLHRCREANRTERGPAASLRSLARRGSESPTVSASISIATSSLFDSLLALKSETDNIYQSIEIMSGL